MALKQPHVLIFKLTELALMCCTHVCNKCGAPQAHLNKRANERMKILRLTDGNRNNAVTVDTNNNKTQIKRQTDTDILTHFTATQDHLRKHTYTPRVS